MSGCGVVHKDISTQSSRIDSSSLTKLQKTASAKNDSTSIKTTDSTNKKSERVATYSGYEFVFDTQDTAGEDTAIEKPIVFTKTDNGFTLDAGGRKLKDFKAIDSSKQQSKSKSSVKTADSTHVVKSDTTSKKKATLVTLKKQDDASNKKVDRIALPWYFYVIAIAALAGGIFFWWKKKEATALKTILPYSTPKNDT